MIQQIKTHQQSALIRSQSIFIYLFMDLNFKCKLYALL